MLTLRDQAIADAALGGKPEPYRRLDTAVLEALILEGALGMTEDDISHFNGLDYARSTEQAREQVESGAAEAAFFMRATPVEQVRDVAGAGESMPPKSTYFFPKVLTGMVFNPLDRLMRATATPEEQAHPRRLRAQAPDDGRRARGPGRRGHGPEPAGAAGRVAGLLHRDHDGDVRQAQGLERRRARGRGRLPAGRARLRDPLRADHEDARPPQRRAGQQAAGDRGEVPRASHARGRSGLRRASRAQPEPPRRARRPCCWRRRRRWRWTCTAARTRPCSPRCTSTPPARCTPCSPVAATTSSAMPARSPSPAGARTRARRSSRRRCARRTRRSGCRRAPSTSSARWSRRRRS